MALAKATQLKKASGKGLSRRNSSLTIVSSSGHVCVKKRYHAKFKANDEKKAYRLLAAFLEGRKCMRSANVYATDETENSICVEFIQGRTLLEDLLGRGTALLDERRKSLVSLFSDMRKAGVRFDCDPRSLSDYLT